MYSFVYRRIARRPHTGMEAATGRMVALIFAGRAVKERRILDAGMEGLLLN